MTDFDPTIPNPNDPVTSPEPETPAASSACAETSAAEAVSTEASASPTAAPAEKVVYRWSYDAQQTAARTVKEPRSKGILVYSIVMSAVFLVSFGLLIAVLIAGRYDPDSPIRPGISGTHDDVALNGIEEARQTVVVIEASTSNSLNSGSGIILRRDGYIATNHHVIAGANSITVTFYDGTTAPAQVVGSSEQDDLAVIKVNRGELREATFANYEDCYVGQTVYAIGAPGGIEFGWTTTRGIVSYIDREVQIYDEETGTLKCKMRLVQTDANVNPGNSGGALVNTDGQVIGVVSSKLSDGYEGIGFAIPADGALDILNALIEGKDFNSTVSFDRPLVGITGVQVEAGKYYVLKDGQREEITKSEVGYYSSKDVIHSIVTGVYVTEVTKGMDAEGKLLVGDVIIAIDDRSITTLSELTYCINTHYVGDTITLKVNRNGQERTIRIKLASAEIA